MPYVHTIPPCEAVGKLREIHECGSGQSATVGDFR
jgi:hypothetical protein